ncbi:MAG TPA: hypothetical protein VFH54_19885 [Mycobacteriales bacterium]|nr:hypothetical protein [Mycobacteriales bacterium]
MVRESLLGRVVVVAGEQSFLAEVATKAVVAGAAVAVVSRTLPELDVTVRFRADPHDPDSWERIAMHIEQHLGPVDGAATDDTSYDVVSATFLPDLNRRGHGAVVCVSVGDLAADVLSSLAGTQRATAPRPDHVEPDR